MKVYLNYDKTHVHPQPYNDICEGWKPTLLMHQNKNSSSEKKSSNCVRPGLGSRPLVNGNFCSSGPLCYFSIAAKDFM